MQQVFLGRDCHSCGLASWKVCVSDTDCICCQDPRSCVHYRETGASGRNALGMFLPVPTCTGILNRLPVWFDEAYHVISSSTSCRYSTDRLLASHLSFLPFHRLRSGFSSLSLCSGFLPFCSRSSSSFLFSCSILPSVRSDESDCVISDFNLFMMYRYTISTWSG